MFLPSASVGPFKSVDSPLQGEIEKGVTFLVGMDEAGDTVFLQALQKSADALGVEGFAPIDGDPRKYLDAYKRRHENTPHVAAVLTYRLSDAEVTELNSTLPLKVALALIVTHDDRNEKTISFAIGERPVLAHLVKDPQLSADVLDMLDATQRWGRFTRRMSFLQAICFALGVLGFLGVVLMMSMS